jgi:hypothetical protein
LVARFGRRSSTNNRSLENTQPFLSLSCLSMSNCSPNLQSAASLPTVSPSYSANLSSSPYILSLARLPGPTPTYALATSPPSNAILLYTASPSGLTKTANLPIGGTGPTAMRVAPDFCGRPTLLSSQQQPGCVKVWDERKGPHPALESQSCDMPHPAGL